MGEGQEGEGLMVVVVCYLCVPCYRQVLCSEHSLTPCACPEKIAPLSLIHTHTEKMNHANKHTNGHRGIWPSLREGSWTGRRHEGAKGGDDGDAQEESFAERPTPQTPKSLRAQLLSEELSIVCLSVFDELELWPPTQWSFCLILSAPGYPSQPLP